MSGVPSVTVINETPTVTVGDTQPEATIVAPSPFRPTRYSIEDYRVEGHTDDEVLAGLLTVLQDPLRLSYATAAGGTIVFRDGTQYTLNDRHTVNSHINVVGESVTDTVITIGANGAGFTFADSTADTPQHSTNQFGGMSGNLTINGNGKTGCPWLVGKCNSRTFLPIQIFGSAGDGMQVYGAQNCVFQNPHIHDNTGFGLRFDYGAAGCVVVLGDIYGNVAGQLGVTGQGGYQHTPPRTPETTPCSQLSFYGTLFEQPATSSAPSVVIGAGKRILLHHCPISAGSATADLSLIKVWTENADLGAPTVDIVGQTLSGNAYTGTAPDNIKVRGLEVDAGCTVVISERTVLNSLYSAWYLEDGANVTILGPVDGLDTSGTYAPATIATTTQGDGTHNEVQTFALTGTPVGGTFNLNFRRQTTANISATANAATVQAALEALSRIGTGNVAVTGGPLPSVVTITFQGALALTNVGQLTAITPLRLENKSGGTSAADQLLQGAWSYGHFIERYNTTDRALIVQMVGEAFPRLHIRASGVIGYGLGTANPDASTYHGVAAQSLRTDAYWHIGDLDTIRAVGSGVSTLSNLPTASATYRDYAVWVQGDGSTVADEMYVCRLMADGTYAWTPVRAAPTAVWVAAGAFMNTSGATASQTTDGRTAIWQLPGGGASNVGGQLYLPYWARGWNIDLYWLAKDGTVTSVTWEASIRLDKVVPPATPANTLVYGTTNVSTNGLTLGDWQALRVVSAYTPTTAGVFNIRVVRTNGAGNTYAGNIGVVGVLCTPVG